MLKNYKGKKQVTSAHNLFIFFTHTFQQYPLKEPVILKNYKGKKQVT